MVGYRDSIVQLRARFEQRFGVPPYLIGDAIWHNDKAKESLSNDGVHCWDAITAYNLYEGLWSEDLAGFAERVEQEFNEHGKIARQAGSGLQPYVVPYVTPGYDDTLIRGHVFGESGVRPVFDRGHDGSTYKLLWDMARRVLQKNPPCVSGQCDLVFVSSFNEWHESTSLEPSIEWGDLYLNLTRDLSAVCIGETPPMQCIRGSSFEGKGIQAHDLRGVPPATAESSQKCSQQ